MGKRRTANAPTEPSEPRVQGIVAMGASAGGLDSLQAVLQSLPSDFPWPILIAQHMARQAESHLDVILQRRSKVAVKEATDGASVEPGVVYVCPPGSEMSVTPEHTLRFRPPSPGRPQRVDHLFASVAAVYEDKAIAVILSGTGGDGANGATHVRQRGGAVIAESEDSARHFGMPSAAIQAGAVDFVRPAVQIGSLIQDIIAGDIGVEGAPPPQEDIDGILQILKKRRGTSFEEYRMPTLRRRIRKRMGTLGTPNVPAYISYLHEHPGELDLLFNALLINVTEFFRDPDAWEVIARDVIPVLAQKARDGQEVRIWSAGCASGEEAYSIAILLHEAVGGREDALSRIKIFATDVDAAALDEARAARFDASRVAKVTPERLARHFHAGIGWYEIAKPIRRMVIFGVHDLTKDPPIGRLDLLVCRNVLIYFDIPLQRRIVAAFRYALLPGGALFVGKSEALPRDGSGFAVRDRAAHVFTREPGPAGALPLPPHPRERSAAGEQLAVDQAAREAPAGPTAFHTVGELVMDAPNLVILLLDERRHVVAASRYAVMRLRGAGGTLEGVPLREALVGDDAAIDHALDRAAGSPLRRASVDGVRVNTRGPGVILDVAVQAFSDAHGRARFLVVGQDVSDVAEAKAAALERTHELQETVEALQSSNEELQSTNEELVTANEELQSSNEELATLNEELQSTNEELETTNEELQSTNEELGALNAELERTGVEVSHLDRVLQGVADISRDAVLAVDAEDTVIRWGRRATELFGLHPDEALPKNVHAVDLQVDHPVLRDLLERARKEDDIVALPPVAVRGRRGTPRWVVVAARAVKDDEGGHLGYVLAFHDRTQEELGERAVAAATARYQALLRGTRAGVLVVDEDGHIVHATHAAEEILGPLRQDSRLWDLVADPQTSLQLKGAVADLTRRPELAAEPIAHAIPITLRDGRRLSIELFSVGTAGDPPLVIVAERAE